VSVHDELAVAEARLAELEAQRADALSRVAKLRAVLELDQPLGQAEKVRLFGDLFRGRRDVFPQRWAKRRSARSGYAPACRNEWVSGICEKPRVRCGVCPNQAFISVADDVLRVHLQGRIVAGVYPLLRDDTSWFVAIDLDGESWREDAVALREAATDVGVPVAVERSRSGDGAHVWVFFSEAVPAVQARRLASALLTDATGRRPAIGLDSYDRLFPSQDVLPDGGFGNLIALPLQHEARDQGCSVFLDDQLDPFADQWRFLAHVGRLDRARVDGLVAAASTREGGVLGVADETEEPDEPWRVGRATTLVLIGPVPDEVRIVLAQQVYVPREGLPPQLVDRIRRLAAFANPVFYERQRLRLPVGHVPRLIGCAEEHPEHIALPRGCLDALETLLADSGVSLVADDRRSDGSPITATFTGELTTEQRAALAALQRHETGVLVAPPGAGKTVIAAALIAERAVATLVLVATRTLVDQWRARLATFLDIEPAAIGTIQGGRRKPIGIVDVATIQTLARDDAASEMLASYGMLVIDECHHVPAISTEKVARLAPARYVLGLTATPQRRDGHQPIIRMQCGPTRHTIRTRPALALRVLRRNTNCQIDSANDVGIQQVYRQLADDHDRNALIVADTLAAIAEGRSPLILTSRIDHLERLAALLRPEIPHLAELHGGLRPADRRRTLAELAESDEPSAIIATGRYLGEGFDHPRLDTLMLALPIAWKGTITQYAGRLHRPATGKHDAHIYDYVDTRIAVLDRMYHKRERTYRTLGYQIETGQPTTLSTAARLPGHETLG
jgi:superfamily II DNA or RNA helicase